MTNKKTIAYALVLTMLLAIGAGIGFYFIWKNAGYLVTDNARVTTTLIPITPSFPSRLERFMVQAGQYVSENEIIGWLENADVMRSPVNGFVLSTNAIQGQTVSYHEPIAFIADMSDIHIQANIEETEIGKIQLGQSVTITIDPFGNREFIGYVSEIGKVTQAELTGQALFFNTGGRFTRVTHLIPVKINVVDAVDLHHFIGVNAKVRVSLRQPVKALPSSGNNQNRIVTKGIVESIDKRNVFSVLEHLVERVYVEVGDNVNAGQVLAVLENVDLHNEVKIAEASLNVAEINVTMAEYNLDTRRVLYKNSAISRDELRQFEFALQSAIAYRQQAQVMLDVMRNTLDRTIIKAPINGTVTAVIAKDGEIGTGLMFVVEDTNNLKIITRFREYDINRIRIGMGVGISSDATGDAVFVGIINRINPVAIRELAPVVEIEAEILVKSVSTGLRIGMNVDVMIGSVVSMK